MLLLPYYLKQPEVPCYSDAHQVTRSNLNLPEAKYRLLSLPIQKIPHTRSHFIKYPKHVISMHNRYGDGLGLGLVLYTWKNHSKLSYLKPEKPKE